jgi:Protein of unknown function (DUF2846).
MIYVYVPKRDSKIHGRIPPTIKLNGNRVGLLKFNGHFALKVTPGKHLLTAQVMGEVGLAKLKLSIGAGEVKYVLYSTGLIGGEIEYHSSSAMYSHSVLFSEVESEALPRISNTKRLKNDVGALPAAP